MTNQIQSKSVRILDIIGSRDGMRFSDIQRELCKMSGLDYDKKVKSWFWRAKTDSWQENERVPCMTKPLRGYWCTNLLGGMHYHQGLLRFYATKGPDGLWRRNKRSHGGHPWKKLPFRGGGNWDY